MDEKRGRPCWLDEWQWSCLWLSDMTDAIHSVVFPARTPEGSAAPRERKWLNLCLRHQYRTVAVLYDFIDSTGLFDWRK